MISRLEATVAAAPPAAALANLFVDRPYNRSNFTLISHQPAALAAAALQLSAAALAALDLRAHAATHPRLGIVDHISCHPLSQSGSVDGSEGLEAAAEAARVIARQLGAAGLPAYLYGAAHPSGAQLADVRRALGYFSADNKGEGVWIGALASAAAALPLPAPPDFGPAAAQPRAGVACVGAVPWLVNLNVLLDTDDMEAVRSVARAVSQRGGGLPGVQAMALRHDAGIEVACNLLRPGESGPAVVEAEVRRLAAAAGLPTTAAYCTGKTPEELAAIAGKLLR